MQRVTASRELPEPPRQYYTLSDSSLQAYSARVSCPELVKRHLFSSRMRSRIKAVRLLIGRSPRSISDTWCWYDSPRSFAICSWVRPRDSRVCLRVTAHRPFCPGRFLSYRLYCTNGLPCRRLYPAVYGPPHIRPCCQPPPNSGLYAARWPLSPYNGLSASKPRYRTGRPLSGV